MAGIAHFSFGFAGKWFSSKIPLLLLLLASEFLDLLWIILSLTGIEGAGGAPWSHGFFMSIVWSILISSIIFIIYRDIKISLITGLVVISHWVLDFITHPMGAIFGGKPLPPDLFLMFYNSPKVGLGLYNHSIIIAYAFELVLFGTGLTIYLLQRRRAALKLKRG